MGALQYLNQLQVVRNKLDWANRYSDRLVKLSDYVFVLRNDMSNQIEEYWHDDDYIKLSKLSARISFKIDVLARYGNILTTKVFNQLKR